MSEYPHIRRLGCYLFFFACAFGVSIEIGVVLRLMDVASWVETNGAGLAGIATFLALRDLTATTKGPSHD